MKFAICNEMFDGWEFHRVCQYVANCGYDGIEIAPFTFNRNPIKIDEAHAATIGQTARAAGLELVAMHWLLAMPPGLHLTTPDTEVRNRTIDFAKHLARLGGAMGAKFMVWGSPKQRDVVEGDTYECAFKRGVEGVRQVCEVAGSLGITVAMEPLGPQETNFMLFADDTIQFIEQVDHPACQLHLDVKAMSSEPDPIPQVIKAGADHLAYFHANDANLRGPGFGQTDYVPIATALKEVGYDGYVSVEVFDYSPDPQTIATQSLAYLKETFHQANAI